MNGFLLDTNVLSEFSKPHTISNPAVDQWLADADSFSLFVSVLSLAEIHKGIEKLESGRRRTYLQEWFNEDLRPIFSDRILPITEDIALRWASLTVTLQKQGKTPSVIDSLIAATALEHDLIIVTRNVSDFEQAGTKLINPWALPFH